MQRSRNLGCTRPPEMEKQGNWKGRHFGAHERYFWVLGPVASWLAQPQRAPRGGQRATGWDLSQLKSEPWRGLLLPAPFFPGVGRQTQVFTDQSKSKKGLHSATERSQRCKGAWRNPRVKAKNMILTAAVWWCWALPVVDDSSQK